MKSRKKAVCGLSLLEVPVCLSVYSPKQWPRGKHTWPVWKQSKPVGWTLTAAQPQRCCPCRAVPEPRVPAAPGCPASAATRHLPRAVTQPPAAKIPDGTELCGVFQFNFFLKIGVLLKLPEPLDGAQFCTQDYLKISSNLEWESTKGMHRFCLQDSYNNCVPNMEFCSFFSSLITQAGQRFQMEYEHASTERSRLYYI